MRRFKTWIKNLGDSQARTTANAKVEASVNECPRGCNELIDGEKDKQCKSVVSRSYECLPK